MRERIQKLIDIYATYVFGLTQDAGWHTPSQLDATQYKSNSGSDLLRKKKFDARFSSTDLHQSNDRADDKMISEMAFVRKKHHDFKFAKWLLEQLKEDQLVALMAEPRLRMAYKRKFKEQEIADYLEIPKKTYNTRRNAGMSNLVKELSRLDEYDSLKAG